MINEHWCQATAALQAWRASGAQHPRAWFGLCAASRFRLLPVHTALRLSHADAVSAANPGTTPACTTTRRTKAAPHRCSVCRQAWLNASRGPTRPADAAAQVSPLPRRCSVCARGNQRCRESRTVDDAGQQEVGAGANATLGSSVPAQALTLATMTGSSTMRSGSAPKRSASGPAPVDSVRQPHGPSGVRKPLHETAARQAFAVIDRYVRRTATLPLRHGVVCSATAHMSFRASFACSSREWDACVSCQQRPRPDHMLPDALSAQ